MTKLPRSTTNNKSKNENSEIVPHLEVTKVSHCNIFNKGYQHNSSVLCTFFLKILPGQLLDVSPKNVISLNAFNLEFSYKKVWFTDQNSNYFSYSLQFNK